MVNEVSGIRKAPLSLAFALSRLQAAAVIWIAVCLLLIRVLLWPIHTSDMDFAFLQWQNLLIANGRMHALKHPVGQYFPAFFELTILTSLLDGFVSRIAQIKLLPFCFDLLATLVSYRLVRLLQASERTFAQGIRPRIAAIFVILAGPTVILNGAAWGQLDIVYTACLLFTIYLVCDERGTLASLMYGVAFAFKLQAIFLAPFYFAMIWRRRIPRWSLLLLPVGWLISLVPPMLVGGSPLSFLGNMSEQTGQFNILAIGVANPWEAANFFHFPYHAGLVIGLVITVVGGLLIAAVGQRQGAGDLHSIAALAALSLLTMPYIMPKMHDRYFFPAEVFLSILACVDIEFLAPAALVISASLISYIGYFLSITRHWATVFGFGATTIALIIVVRHVLRLGNRSLQDERSGLRAII